MSTNPQSLPNKIEEVSKVAEQYKKKGDAALLKRKLKYLSSKYHALGPLDKHTDEIVDVLKTSYVKEKIQRKGGYSTAGEQRILFRKIVENNKEILNDNLAKTALKKLIAHFGHDTGKARDRVDRFIEQGQDMAQAPQGVTSANKLNTDAQTSVQKYHSTGETFGRANTRVISSANKFSRGANTGAVSSINRLNNQRPIEPLSPPKSSSPRVSLAI